VGREFIEAESYTEDNGTLYVFDEENLPFVVSRLFFVCAPKGATRGKHAHRSGRQFLTVVNGRINVSMRTLSGKSFNYQLNTGQGVYMPALTWGVQEFVEQGSVLLVLCDSRYNESDYIRDEREFLKMSRKGLSR